MWAGRIVAADHVLIAADRTSAARAIWRRCLHGRPRSGRLPRLPLASMSTGVSYSARGSRLLGAQAWLRSAPDSGRAAPTSPATPGLSIATANRCRSRTYDRAGGGELVPRRARHRQFRCRARAVPDRPATRHGDDSRRSSGSASPGATVRSSQALDAAQPRSPCIGAPVARGLVFMLERPGARDRYRSDVLFVGALAAWDRHQEP